MTSQPLFSGWTVYAPLCLYMDAAVRLMFKHKDEHSHQHLYSAATLKLGLTVPQFSGVWHTDHPNQQSDSQAERNHDARDHSHRTLTIA